MLISTQLCQQRGDIHMMVAFQTLLTSLSLHTYVCVCACWRKNRRDHFVWRNSFPKNKVLFTRRFFKPSIAHGSSVWLTDQNFNPSVIVLNIIRIYMEYDQFKSGASRRVAPILTSMMSNSTGSHAPHLKCTQMQMTFESYDRRKALRLT